MTIWSKMKTDWFTREALIGWLPPAILGGILRFWSLGFGLPNRFRPDEDMVLLPALGMIGGNLDPNDYTYPTLYKYMLALVFRITMLLDLGAERFEHAWQYAAYGFFIDETFFFYVGRFVTALLSVATLLAVYRIGCDAYNKWVGTASAWLLAVSVLHVRDSHFGVTDIPSAALLTIAMVYTVRIALTGETKNYVWAGVCVGLASSTKYGAILGCVPIAVAHLIRRPSGIPLISRWIWDRSAWMAAGLCLIVFAVTSPYIVWNVEGFVRDFGFQMRHVFEYGHAADLGPGWLYHPQVTLRYGLGLLALLGCVAGLILALIRREPADWVLLSLFVAFFVVTGRGRTVFFRYVLPLIPLCCIFAGVALDWLRQLTFVRTYAGVIGIALLVACVVEPLSASVKLNILFGREDTRALARDWIEKNIPEGQFIANVGGLYGDVSIKNSRAVAWWLRRFYWAFPDVPEADLAAYLAQFENDLPPFFLYHHFIGNRDLDARAQGWLETLDHKDIAIVVTHEHPLPYSQVNSDFMAALEERAYIWAQFEPGYGHQDAVFDLQDAFYYPIGQFGETDRGGPLVKVWRLYDKHGLAMADARDQKKLIHDTFVGLGNGEFVRDELDDALGYYHQAVRADPEASDVRIFMAAIYLRKEDYNKAAEEVRRALAKGKGIGDLERFLFFERAMDGETYARLGAVCGMVGYYQEATQVYERALEMGYMTVEVLNNLGVIYHTQKNYRRAIWAFHLALKIDPNHADAQRNLRLSAQKLSE